MRGQFQIIINFTRFNFESYIAKNSNDLYFDLKINGEVKLRGISKIFPSHNRWIYSYPEFKKKYEFDDLMIDGVKSISWIAVNSLNDIDLINDDIDIIRLFKKFIWLNLEAQEGLANAGGRPND